MKKFLQNAGIWPFEKETPDCGIYGLPMFWRSAQPEDIQAGCRSNLDLFCEGEQGNKPIHFCAMYSSGECLKLLMKKYDELQGISNVLEIKNKDGLDPLNLAIQQGNEETTCLLIELYEEREFDGANNLLLSAIHSQSSATIVQCILKVLPSKNKIKKEGFFLAQACHYGNIDVVKLLINEGAATTQALYLQAGAETEKELRILEILIEAVDDVNQVEIEASALEYALSFGCETGIWMLINAGADINFSRNVNGRIFDAKTVIDERHEMIRKGKSQRSPLSDDLLTLIQEARLS